MKGPEDKLGFLLKMIHFTFESRINEVLKKYDLTRSQCDIIMFLSRTEQLVTQRMIEKTFHISNPTVTGLLNRLESKEFIERKVSDKDARFKYIILTDKAKILEKEIRNQLDENERYLFSCLKDDEIEELRNTLKRIVENI